MARICVFCGAARGADESYAAQAEALGSALVAAGHGLVFGGGAVGLMGVVADAVLAAGGEAVGVIPQQLVDRELAHRGLSDLRIVGSMHERKALMASLSDAFIALPGGFGTLDELVEIITWRQLDLHSKPIGLLDAAGFWQPFTALVEHLRNAGFLRVDPGQILYEDDAARLLERLA
ncbi:MAG: hypothetical protein QOE98_1214 [Gaiellaceae bacterium]|nr:hypothetical protein [Gaiellaceae bacterium]